MKRKILIMLTLVIVSLFATLTLSGCNQSGVVSYNLSKEADNFNIIRQITVINCLEGEVLFQMTGRISIAADNLDSQLEVIVMVAENSYQKHIIGLSDNVAYVLEQKESADINNYQYTLIFNPNMWWIIDGEIVNGT